MKKYFKYTNHTREILQKPAKVTFEEKSYISFTNSWSLALTTEDPGEIELFEGKYPDVTRLLRFDGIKKKIDIRAVIAEAKSKGYKLTKSEVGPKFQYLLFYDEAYYKIGLLDITFAIIDDGELPITYHPASQVLPITIQNRIGMCVIMPVRYEGDPEEDGKIVIRVE